VKNDGPDSRSERPQGPLIDIERSEFYLREGERLAHMGSWSLRADGIFDYWSPETFAIFGFDPAQGIPTLKEWLDVHRPPDGDRVHALIRKMFSQGVKGDIQYRVEHPEHGQKTMRSTGDPMFENGVVTRLIGNTLDITKQEELTQELRRREAYLAEAQKLSHTGSFGWDVSSGEIFWSDETFRIFELDPKIEITIKLIVERTHPDDREAVQQVIERASRDRTEFAVEHRLLIPGGSIKYLQVVGRPSTDEGHRSEFVGAVTDITNHRQAEERIREQEIELRQILDLTPHHLYVFGPDGGLLYVNQFALAYLGADLAEMVAPTRINFLHPDDRPGYLAVREKGLLAGKAYEFELRILRHDGIYRWFLGRGNPLKDEQGRITRWYNTATDIEDRKRAEEEIQKENIVLRQEIGSTSMFEEVLGTSAVLQRVLALAAKVAPTDSTVLIMGETGTGKELIARATHKRSKRAERSFVSVNCAAIPSSLIMSELFGHEKGAFTGAVQRRLGRFELAEGGTLFLDEVGDLPLETQIALLRVLQEREFERVGGTEMLRSDVRVIAATNRDLHSAIAAGSFRSDLFYRLNVFPIELPPLRERKEDIPILVNYFVNRYAQRAGRKIDTIQKKSLEALQEYSWPGNVRELQNVIERSLIVVDTNEFSVDKNWLSHEFRSSPRLTSRISTEQEQIETALAQTKGKVSGRQGAATILGIPASTLESKIRTLRINKHAYKGA
jgi:PAS domain S-box-containing protein